MVALAQSGCVDKDAIAQKETAERIERARLGETQRLESHIYNVHNLTKLAINEHSISAWTGGSMLLEQSSLNLYLGLSDTAVIGGEQLTAEVSCSTIGAGRASVTVAIEPKRLTPHPDYPGGLLAIKNCFGVDTTQSHINSVGKHDVVLTIRGKDGKPRATATLPIEVTKFSHGPQESR
jgi:hypothetical protein